MYATDEASIEIVVITNITFTSANEVKPKIKNISDKAMVGAKEINRKSDCGSVIHFFTILFTFFFVASLFS